MSMLIDLLVACNMLETIRTYFFNFFLESKMKLSRTLMSVLIATASVSAACTSTSEVKTDEATAAAATEEKTADQQLDDAIKIALDTVYFEFDSYTLTASAAENLKTMAAALVKLGGSKIMIEGHSDERGSNEYNLSLAQKRAETIKNFLVSEGVGSDNIETASFGEERPASEGHDESAFAKNRRGEFKRVN